MLTQEEIENTELIKKKKHERREDYITIAKKQDSKAILARD